MKVANSMVTALFSTVFLLIIVKALFPTGFQIFGHRSSKPTVEWQAVMTNEEQITAISPASIVSNVGNPGQW